MLKEVYIYMIHVYIYRWRFQIILFKCSPRKLGKMNPFWRAYLFKGVGSTTNYVCIGCGPPRKWRLLGNPGGYDMYRIQAFSAAFWLVLLANQQKTSWRNQPKRDAPQKPTDHQLLDMYFCWIKDEISQKTWFVQVDQRKHHLSTSMLFKFLNPNDALDTGFFVQSFGCCTPLSIGHCYLSPIPLSWSWLYHLRIQNLARNDSTYRGITPSYPFIRPDDSCFMSGVLFFCFMISGSLWTNQYNGRSKTGFDHQTPLETTTHLDKLPIETEALICFLWWSRQASDSWGFLFAQKGCSYLLGGSSQLVSS